MPLVWRLLMGLLVVTGVEVGVVTVWGLGEVAWLENGNGIC